MRQTSRRKTNEDENNYGIFMKPNNHQPINTRISMA